ncbi:hypothetical protein GCM10007973_27360 [Polymorphobacter multimanifer]|uniref:DMT family protein n=1 Tax=Polymorphobacter multimanifer TaxID=1070431 RepID=A0A841LJK0_9SPHN|nr:DMT family protein [Polymorphobacter multimanifer]MBB6229402.1 hypothetical protein [Polymorphobacter multimanifer]GGI89565.1 hypothetical protein GCM10007973_27360 [Polymorphobacter multimanifer]
MAGLSPGLTAALLLTVSNIFMTIAWYGHLKFKAAPLVTVVLISWGIALIEYCFAVPANRIGHATLTAPQLKGMQEIISILVFAVFSTTVLGQPISARQALGFALIVVAAVLIIGD